MKQPDKVASPPAKPLLVYDGDCNFCKFWIARWQQATQDHVDYLPSQDSRVAAQFPELPPESFATSVQFIETNGQVYRGAEAVFRSLAYGPGHRWPLVMYNNLPGVATVTEWMYEIVASHREGFSKLTNWLWGPTGAAPSHYLIRSVFLRFLGIIYLCAFVSLAVQINGLIGSNGILPASQFMTGAQARFEELHLGVERYNILPTLCWFSTSDGFLHFLCGAGIVLSVLLTVGITPAPCLFLLWLIYLSLSVVSRDFLSFQWDTLLLETGFLAIFFAPLTLWLSSRAGPPPSRVMRWLLCWLLFRLMFESGIVKLLSGDTTWTQFAALSVHYETQPLPTWIGWYAHQCPAWVHTWCVKAMFFIELVAPFLIFTPRRPRFVGCALLVLLQLCIMATGNYCFFNLLTIALCLLLLDDAALGRRTDNLKSKGRAWSPWITSPLAVFILLITAIQLVDTSFNVEVWPQWVEATERRISSFRTLNRYGLFRVMTTKRLEIVVEGSSDGQTWLPYEFKYKPGDVKQPPRFVAPHQPRLDWQMWFAVLGSYDQSPWFVSFSKRLLQGTPEVLSLLKQNPFPNAPPKYLRASLYQYHFTNFAERRATGDWWRREYLGEYLPVVSLRGDEKQ